MENLRLVFSGDLAPTGRVEKACIEGTIEKHIESLTKNIIADLHITNLECPLTVSDQPILKSGPSVKASPSCIQLLNLLHVNIACMANNHIQDYGKAGIVSTLELCQHSGIQTVGAGLNLNDAGAIRYLEIKKKRLAFLNYCEEEFSIATQEEAGANPIDLIKIFNDITEAKTKADLIFVILHGGHEEYNLPSPRIKKLFRYCADVGASAVIGHHPHVVSGYEIYKGKPLIYSLGNFIFDDPENNFNDWFTGALAFLEINEDNSICLEIKYIVQEKDQLNIRMANELENKHLSDKCKELSELIGNDTLLEKMWIANADKYEKGFTKQVFHFNLIKKALYKFGICTNILIRKKEIPALLNIIRCESHREILIHTLKNKL
jgi:poly-gamma-glutamate synthesis protein (capsule biosynthesis protein)